MTDPPGPHGPHRAVTFAETARLSIERKRASAAEMESQEEGPSTLPAESRIHHFDPAKAATDPSYKGTIMDFIPPNHLTERSTQKNSVYIQTRGCKLNPKVILTHIENFFEQDMEAFRYTKNRGRFEVNLKPEVNPAKYIYQSIPVGNMALQVEKAYRADKNLAIIRLSDLPLRSADTLIEYIQDYFSEPTKVLEIMIDVAGRLHCPSGTATVVLDISEFPDALEHLPRRMLMEDTMIQLTWKDCPFL